MSAALQQAKQVVLNYYAALDDALVSRDVSPGPASVSRPAAVHRIAEVLAKHSTAEYQWRGMHPFHEQSGPETVAEVFWGPLAEAFSSLQRRPDVFLAGEVKTDTDSESHVGSDSASHVGSDSESDVGSDSESSMGSDSASDPNCDDVWVCQMGHLLGLFDAPWLDIPPTGKMCFLRYAEFHRVEPGQGAHGRIAETALFIDVISVMRQAGHYPLPPQTGASHVHPGPKTHDGLLVTEQDPERGRATMALVKRMIDDLTRANEIANDSGEDRVPRSMLAETWHEDMIWSGPEGIGATYTIDRYQQQHQYPFRFNLSNKQFHGHVARFAEGDYACFFGWANLSNTADGGFLGMTGNTTPADMRVVDVYRRDGDRLAENWVFIDLLHWLDMQGLDVLARMRQLLGVENI